MRKERIVLKDHIDRAPIGRNADDGAATDQNVPLTRLFEPGDDSERGRLATAGRAEQRNEGALSDVQVHAVDGRYFAVALGNRSKTDVNLLHEQAKCITFRTASQARGRRACQLGCGAGQVGHGDRA